jgi:hypothetical protein
MSREGVLAIIVCQGRATELTGENIGDRLEELSQRVIVLRGLRANQMEQFPARWTPKSCVHLCMVLRLLESSGSSR